MVTDGRKTILVVDDDPSVLRYVVSVLQSHGHEVIEAPGPEEALKTLGARPVPLSLLVTDVNMAPIDGIELARKIRAGNPDLRVLYITGFAEAKEAVTAEATSGSGYLRKPFGPVTLWEKARALLEGREY